MSLNSGVAVMDLFSSPTIRIVPTSPYTFVAAHPHARRKNLTSKPVAGESGEAGFLANAEVGKDEYFIYGWEAGKSPELKTSDTDKCWFVKRQTLKDVSKPMKFLLTSLFRRVYSTRKVGKSG
jgi:hypothetical protein